MSTLLSILVNLHVAAGLLGYAAGAYTFPKIKAKLAIGATKVEQDLKK